MTKTTLWRANVVVVACAIFIGIRNWDDRIGRG